MPEIIQDWLGTTLGIVIDMAPNRFGRIAKDGKLLAKLLYNYGVIPANVLKKVKETNNYYECLNNLSVLKPWLKYIGVTHENSTFENMACGEGSAAVSVFYSVYLNLEQKDRLHYLSAQKERRVSAFSCDKFKVSWVPERFVSGEAGDGGLELSAPIYENREMIEWHKAKCEQIIGQIKKAKLKFRKVTKKKKQLGPLVSKHASSKPLDKRQTEAEETLEDINTFEKNHPEECRNLNFAELKEMKDLMELQPLFIPNMTDANNTFDDLKRQKKAEVYARNFQQKMHNIFLEEQWKEIIDKQEVDFERKVCANLIKQSQYEKQMMAKLSLLRNQKRVLVENRKRLESLKIDRCQQEYDETVQRNVELRGEYGEDERIEKERIAELHRRIYDERVRIRREAIRNESRRIVEALMDISIRIAEHRELIGAQIPKALMKDMKELFFKDLSIFDILEHFEDVCKKDTPRSPCEPPDKEDVGEWEGEDQKSKEQKTEESERQSFLDECDFNDYLQLMGPWMVELLLPNDSDMEGSQLILGHIVHKILAVKYPPANVPAPVCVKPMKPSSALYGLNDESALEMLTDLMEGCKVLVVKVGDAINFVLLAYKEELSVVRDIDITFQDLTEEALWKRSSDGMEKDVSKKLQLLKVECSEMSGEEPFMLDKEVQTPRMIPEDDPVFSPNAELGKLAFEALGAGDPVPDPVIARALVAYIVSKQDDYCGLVILDYPQLYPQASDLEFFLTGYRALPPLDEMETLEDVEEFSYRGPWGNPSKDSFARFRTSRLVPKPENLEGDQTTADIPRTFFDSVIKMKKVGGTPRRRSDETRDSDELSLVEKFYSNLQILFTFEYQNLSFQTVKNLGRRILGEADNMSDPNLERKTSSEVFGSILSELNEKWDPKRKPGKEGNQGVVKKLVGELSESQMGQEWMVMGAEGTEEEEEEPRTPQPGDPNWDWATGDQPEELLTALACVWENMEAVYIEDFKKLFFCLRVHRSNLINYCGFIRNNLRTLMRRPDEKQKVLSDFQQMFNDIDEDLRPDRDIKCELHVRVSEVEQVLMSIADERKKNSIQDMAKVAQDGWAAEEMANLINIFLSALQLEADRSIDSCQVITDYYTSLQQKIPEAKPIGKVAVPKLHVEGQRFSIGSSVSSRSPFWPSPINSEMKRRSTAERASKTRSIMDKRRRSSETLAGAAEFITEILATLTLPEDGVTPFHTFFTESVQIVTNEVRNILETYLGEARKTEKPPTKISRKPSEANFPPSNENVTPEYVAALQNEISRFTFRSQLILARGIFELNDFLAMILNLLSTLTEEITEMYLKEIRSISECCKVFRCAIEREIMIKPVLELKQEQFLVHVDCAESSSEEVTKPRMSEDEKRLTFTTQQLNLLFEKLQRVAPGGEIVKRALAYILEDLRVLSSEVENGRCLPEIWSDIEPDDVMTVLNEVFQNLEIVHWKDLIIYALDIPFPSEREILSMRKIFRKFDPQVSELVTRENYDVVTLWFEEFADEEEMEKSRNVKDFLYRMFQVDDFQTNYSALLLAFCKDEDPVAGFEKALALAMGRSIRSYEESPRDSVLGEVQSFDLGLFDSDRESEKPPCCPPSNTTIQCIPKEKIVRCECKLPEAPSVESSSGSDQIFLPEEDAREDDFHYDTRGESPKTSLIPYSILSSLLKASFPLLPQLSILLDCEQTLQETLMGIYDGLEAHNNTLEVQKLVKHKFINRLLYSTNKFKHVNLKTVLLSLTKDKTPPSRAASVRVGSRGGR